MQKGTGEQLQSGLESALNTLLCRHEIDPGDISLVRSPQCERSKLLRDKKLRIQVFWLWFDMPEKSDVLNMMSD